MDIPRGCSSLPVMLASPLTYAFFPLICVLSLCTDAEIAMDFLLSSLVAYDHDVLVFIDQQATSYLITYCPSPPV